MLAKTDFQSLDLNVATGQFKIAENNDIGYQWFSSLWMQLKGIVCSILMGVYNLVAVSDLRTLYLPVYGLYSRNDSNPPRNRTSPGLFTQAPSHNGYQKKHFE